MKLSNKILEKAYHEGTTMLVTYSKLQQINYSVNAGYYLTTIKHKQAGEVGFALRGRYHLIRPEDVRV